MTYSTSSTNVSRTYENAIALIRQRRSTGRPQPKQNENIAPNSVHYAPVSHGEPSILGMKEWLAALGHTEDDINALNIIHVAGTKGKGSTCSFTESFLRAHGNRTGFPKKTGLYTSPHLLHPEERIRINFEPLPRDLLARYFFEVYDKLPQLAGPPNPEKPSVERGPRILQLWAILAFHTFIREGVDVVIMETHNGGEYDATNVVTKPLVTVVTTLALDHVEILGRTIQNVAWHKGGIYKKGAVALSTRQQHSAMEVLEERAQQVGQKLEIIDEDSKLPTDALHLEPSLQRKNASLAVAAAEAFVRQTSATEPRELSSEDLYTGVEQWSWPGRYEIFQHGAETWFLDAAHCELSVALAAQWFAKETTDRSVAGEIVMRVLIFSHMNHLRDSRALLGSLISELKDCNAGIQHVVFSTYAETTESTTNTTEMFNTFAGIWRETFPDARVWTEPTVQGAIERARQLRHEQDKSHILVTGSQHLLGPALRQLKQN